MKDEHFSAYSYDNRSDFGNTCYRILFLESTSHASEEKRMKYI
jgi:hypothetical protein